MSVAGLGDFLREHRAQALHNASLRELSRRSGGQVSATYLGTLERGAHPKSGKVVHPSAEILKIIADAYDVSYAHLLHLANYLPNESAYTFTQEERDIVDASSSSDPLAVVLANLLMERQRENTLREEKEKIREEKEREAQANERLRIEKEYALRERELEAIRIPEQQRFNQVAEDLHQLVKQITSPHATGLPDEPEATETSYGR